MLDSLARRYSTTPEQILRGGAINLKVAQLVTAANPPRDDED